MQTVGFYDGLVMRVPGGAAGHQLEIFLTGWKGFRVG